MRRVKILYITVEQYLNLLFASSPPDAIFKPMISLPEGTVLERWFPHPETDSLAFVLSNPHWEEVHPGIVPPSLPYNLVHIENCNKCGMVLETSKLHNCPAKSNFGNKLMDALGNVMPVKKASADKETE